MSTPPIPIPTITSSGISSPSYNSIVTAMTAIFQSIFGSDVLLTPDTQEGQWIAVLALGYYDYGQALVALYNSLSPVFAQGAQLSALVKINGLQRLIPTNSTVTVTITGVAGTVINNGVVQDTNGNLWTLPPTVTIPGGGTINVVATAEVNGAIQASPSTVTIIFTPTLGWQSVNNASAAVVGSPVESDAALRGRQSISTSLPAQTPVGAIIAAVANLPGVVDSQIYENPTNSTDSNGIPAHSICVVVALGSATTTQVAQLIEAKKSPGTGTFGNTTIIVNDPAGLPVAINFSLVTFTSIWVSVTVKGHANFVAATQQQIVNNIVNFINSLPIGTAVFFNQIMSIAGVADTATGLTYNVTVLTTGTAPSPAGTSDITIAFDHAAQTDSTKVIVTVT